MFLETKMIEHMNIKVNLSLTTSFFLVDSVEIFTSHSIIDVTIPSVLQHSMVSITNNTNNYTCTDSYIYLNFSGS